MGKRETKFQQYAAAGEVLYVKHCSNCHQEDGTGLRLLYPPVNTSDFLDSNFNEAICLMKYGKKGAISVNGKIFNQPMPGIRSLTPLELAELSTYLYNTWGRQKGIIETSEVERIVERCVRN